MSLKTKNFVSTNQVSALFLGVDGGQSHTEAIVADENGNVLASGFGGASNHAEHPGGQERLRNAIIKSVGEALKDANLPPIEKTVFTAAHFGMTGGADYKGEIIGEIVKAEHLIVGHDATTALFGATAGEPGIVVIAGTGSVVYGENKCGETTKIGGLGYLFSDEGSGFWLALQTIRLAIKEQDGLLAPSGLEQLVLDFFGRGQIRELTNDFYNAKITRDNLAGFAKAAHDAAAAGNLVIREQIRFGASLLVESVRSADKRLSFQDNFPVAGVGGMFQGELMRKYFQGILEKKLPNAIFVNPRFNPAIGALLLAYKQAK
ncbi:MAG TPA: BadF/BadG/BcrA/BcrD ATPase family protein, partial [Pyrinomonadaceae bacterium]|nr:BadF/BadG/BcrA/BcrD ATPase family protein [Pyrinomonadaceae bacterium]